MQIFQQLFKRAEIPNGQGNLEYLKEGMKLFYDNPEMYFGNAKEQTRVFVGLVIDLVNSRSVPFPSQYMPLLEVIDRVIYDAEFRSDWDDMSVFHGTNDLNKGSRLHVMVKPISQNNGQFNISVELGNDWAFGFKTVGDDSKFFCGKPR